MAAEKLTEENKTAKSGSMIHDLTVGSVPVVMIKFAAPLFLSGALQTIYNMVDMIIVGRYVGKEGLSAVSVGGEVLIFLTFVAIGLSNAGQVIISQYLGAGQRDRIKKLIGTLFTFLPICALSITVICLLLRNSIMEWVNMPEEALEDGMNYVMVCILGLVFIYGYNIVSAILRGMGDSKHPLMFIGVASAINLVLDLLLVVVVGLGALGAALATVMGQSISFLWSIVYLYRRREQFGFDFKRSSFGIDKDSMRPLLTLGIPMILQAASISFSKLFITSWVNTYGVVASAVSGIGNKLQSFTQCFTLAVATAGATMIAQCIGANKFDRVKKVIGTSYVIDGVLAATLATVTVIFPEKVFGIFTSDEEVLAMCMDFIPVMLALYGSCILRPPMMALINGSGHSSLNLTVALLDGIAVRIGLAYVLGKVLNFGVFGFWYGNAFSGFMPFIIGMPFYLSGRWKHHKNIS